MENFIGTPVTVYVGQAAYLYQTGYNYIIKH